MEKRELKIRKTITISPELAEKIEIEAKEENRTTSNLIEFILRKHFRNSENQK